MLSGNSICGETVSVWHGFLLQAGVTQARNMTR